MGGWLPVPASILLELVDNDDLDVMKELFRAGVMSLGSDPTTAQVLIEAYDRGGRRRRPNATPLGSSSGRRSRGLQSIAGEQPYWYFPDGLLTHRAAAAYLMSEVLGWSIVPRTWLRDGQSGEGMVQLWQETDLDQNAVDMVPEEDVPNTGWKEVL